MLEQIVKINKVLSRASTNDCTNLHSSNFLNRGKPQSIFHNHLINPRAIVVHNINFHTIDGKQFYVCRGIDEL